MTRRSGTSPADGTKGGRHEKPADPASGRTKERDAAFLVDEFEVETHDAAELVADNEPEADKIAQHEYDRQREQDSLEGVPTPHSPDDGPVERVQNHMQKEVRHDRKS